MKVKNSKLMRRLFLLAFLASVLPAATVGLVAYQQGRDALRTAALERLTVATEAARAKVRDFMVDKLAETAMIAGSHDLSEVTASLIASFHRDGTSEMAVLPTQTPGYRALLDSADSHLAGYGDGMGLEDLAILCARHGHVLYSARRGVELGQAVDSAALADGPVHRAFKQVRKTGMPALTDFGWNGLTKQWEIRLAAPILNEKKELLGVFVARLDATMLNDLLQASGRLGKSGLVYLVGEDSKPRTPLADDDAVKVMESVLKAGFVKAVVEHETTSGDGIDDHGEAILFVGDRLELDERAGTDFDWGIIGEIEQAEAYASVHSLGRLVGIISLVTILAALLLAYLIAIRTAAPLRRGIAAIATASEQISVTSSELAASASQSSAAIAETTVTFEEVKQTAMVAADKAKMVADQARTTAETSAAGSRAVQATIQRMETIRAQMGTVSEAVVKLSEHSHAIGEIISAVDDLAEQSNLLAVNASIEAAKAGEQGKGFAVVAQEMRSLAEQSKDATRQVRSILADVQKATGAAVMATEQGTKSVAAGAEQSEEAGEAIGNLAQAIREAVAAAHQIAASSQQQLSGVEQVTDAMEGIRESSRQNEDGARQLDEAIARIKQVGHDLKSLVSRGD